MSTPPDDKVPAVLNRQVVVPEDGLVDLRTYGFHSGQSVDLVLSVETPETDEAKRIARGERMIERMHELFELKRDDDPYGPAVPDDEWHALQDNGDPAV